MESSAALQPEAAPITACTICRDVQNFDLLIEDMEAELGESWGDLSFDDALPFFAQPEAGSLEFVAIAIDNEDEDQLQLIGEIISAADERGIRVVLVAEDVSPVALHQLLRLGATDFLPYPLPEGALSEALERMRRPAPEPMAHVHVAGSGPVAGGGGGRNGVVLPVHGLAGGVGATTLAVNLAWELANPDKSLRKTKDAQPPKVCLLDLDFQTGSVGTYLDLPRRDAVFEFLSDLQQADAEAMLGAMQLHEEKLHVLTAPSEMLPLDIVSADDMKALIELARASFDFVVIDMPSTLVVWSEAVLSAAHVYFALLELDMRSAQNTLRFVRLLKGEDLPVERIRYGLNRAPRLTDLQGKARAKRLAESLDIDIELMLPDGGRQVAEADDHGLPLSVNATKNPLRKEIAKLAASLHELAAADAAGG
ncbi:MAG: AAA family ATPase [Paracoccaceae bacterium]|jgi:pilus assembly protein CpaE|nr:AAA family ATPase [Paracoccaceae bacterium]